MRILFLRAKRRKVHECALLRKRFLLQTALVKLHPAVLRISLSHISVAYFLNSATMDDIYRWWYLLYRPRRIRDDTYAV